MHMPDRLARRPQFQGMPVPFTVFVSEAGIPDFKINDMAKWMECAQQQLCALCGQILGYYSWFIGGPKQIEAGFFIDLGMHEECARYACEVCPFIAMGRSYATHVSDHNGLMIQQLAPTGALQNPKDMFLVKVRRGSCRLARQEGHYFIVIGPVVSQERIVRQFEKEKTGT